MSIFFGFLTKGSLMTIPLIKDSWPWHISWLFWMGGFRYQTRRLVFGNKKRLRVRDVILDVMYKAVLDDGVIFLHGDLVGSTNIIKINRMLLLCFFSALLFWPETSTDTENQPLFQGNSSCHIFPTPSFCLDAMLVVGRVHSCIPEHRLRVLNPRVSGSKLHDSFGMKNSGRSWGYPTKIFQQSEPNHKVVIEV